MSNAKTNGLPQDTLTILTGGVDAAPEFHNYEQKLKSLWKDGTIPFAGAVSDVLIAHDDWCGLYSGKRCDCDPIIIDRETKEVYEPKEQL